MSLYPFSNGLIHDGVVMAGLFFLSMDKGRNALIDKRCKACGIGGVVLVV